MGPHSAHLARSWTTVLTLILAFSLVQPAQGQNGRHKNQDEGFAISPIPTVAPVTEEGAGLSLEYRYHLNPKNKMHSSSSGTAVGGFITTNGSWGLGVAQKFYLDEDRWKTRALATYLDVRYNFYGLGTAAGDQGTSVLMEQRGYGAMGEVLYRFHELWYAGGQYRVLKLDSSFRPNPAFDTSVIDPNQLDTITAAVVPRFARDSRDDLNYPRKGSLFEFRAALNGSKVGSELTYQLYNLSYNRYVSLSPKQVFAVRGAACLGRGDVPFFNECVLTTAENLRGYRASRYMDDAMVAFQSEYRLEIWNRLGAVAFAGAGQVGSRFSDFDWGNVRPGGGIGARVRITQKGHVNMRFDYAWGKNSRQGYFFLGEAF